LFFTTLIGSTKEQNYTAVYIFCHRILTDLSNCLCCTVAINLQQRKWSAICQIRRYTTSWNS